MKQKDALTQAFREEVMGQNPAEPNLNSDPLPRGCGATLLFIGISAIVGVAFYLSGMWNKPATVYKEFQKRSAVTSKGDYSKTNMPPGWTLMCSEDGLFVLRRDRTGFIYNGGCLVDSNKSDIVRTAWLFYEDERKPEMKLIERNWKECAP